MVNVLPNVLKISLTFIKMVLAISVLLAGLNTMETAILALEIC